jgi:hypothetical protein
MVIQISVITGSRSTLELLSPELVRIPPLCQTQIIPGRATGGRCASDVWRGCWASL